MFRFLALGEKSIDAVGNLEQEPGRHCPLLCLDSHSQSSAVVLQQAWLEELLHGGTYVHYDLVTCARNRIRNPVDEENIKLVSDDRPKARRERMMLRKDVLGD